LIEIAIPVDIPEAFDEVYALPKDIFVTAVENHHSGVVNSAVPIKTVPAKKVWSFKRPIPPVNLFVHKTQRSFGDDFEKIGTGRSDNRVAVEVDDAVVSMKEPNGQKLEKMRRTRTAHFIYRKKIRSASSCIRSKERMGDFRKGAIEFAYGNGIDKPHGIPVTVQIGT
jgi:hypothetical protein